MKNPLNIDKYLVGAGWEAAVIVVGGGVVWAVTSLLGYPIAHHLQWLAAALLPGIILVRYYAKTREYPRATKGAVTVMFVATVAFLAYLLKQRII